MEGWYRCTSAELISSGEVLFQINILRSNIRIQRFTHWLHTNRAYHQFHCSWSIKILLQRASHDSLKCPLARLMGNSLSWGALERCLRRGAAHWWPLCTTKTCSQNTLGPGNGPFCPLVLSTDTALHPNIIIIWLRRNVLTSPASNEDGPGAKTQ